MSPTERLIFIVVAVILIYVSYKYISSRIHAATLQAQQKGEIDALKASGQKQSYSDSKYDSLADQLFEAMDGPGTDEEAVLNVLNQLRTDVDFVKLDAAFGLRGSSWSISNDTYDLSTWLKDDGFDLTELNALLKKKNLTKRF